MAVNIPTNIDHGARNSVLAALAAEVIAQGGTVNGMTGSGGIGQSAGETEPNWFKFLDEIIVGANGLGGTALPRYSSIDYNAFYTVASSIAAKLNGSTGTPVAPSNTTAPNIIGTPTVGSNLDCAPGNWTGTPAPTFAYQWQRNGTNIVINGTSQVYTLVPADLGAQISCAVTATNSAGNATANSNAVTVVAGPAIPTNTSPPVVSGNTAQGSVLSVANGGWLNSPTGYTYQWRRGSTNITGMTGNQYTTVLADVGLSISCAVVATNAAGSSTPAISNGIVVTAYIDPNAPQNTTPPSIVGNGTVGQTLTADPGVWTNSPTTYSRAWQRDGVDIAPIEQGWSYTLQAADAGHNITFRCSGGNINGYGPVLITNSIACVAVQAGSPVNTTAPVVTSTGLNQGDVASCTDGVWSNSPIAWMFQWCYGDAILPIYGATSDTFTLNVNTVGRQLSCLVTAVNSTGASAPVMSNILTIPSP
jgi:hypothetical protein